MAVPKKKTSSSKKRMRRSHDALGKNTYIIDKKNGQVHRPHHIDATGSYKGRQVIDIKESSE